VGPVLAAQFGYLPGTLWILIGVTLGGAVQDFVVLFCSMRRNGKSLAQMVKEELNTTAGTIGTIAILAIMIILLAVLALVVVKALAESPWGIFTVGATIPIAMFMGGYLRYWRVGKVMEASSIGGTSREGFMFVPAYRLHDKPQNAAGYGPNIFPDGAAHDWSLVYSPDVNREARMILTLDGKGVSLPVPNQNQAMDAHFNRFGLISTHTDGNAQLIYFDDVTYTVSQ